MELQTDDFVVKFPLTGGQYTLIDASIGLLIAQYSWYLNGGYVKANINGRKVYLHRFIMAEERPNMLVDHINGDRLDNRKINLRWVTPQQNGFNRKAKTNSSSQYKCVHFDNRSNCYVVQVKGFVTEEDAAKAADLIMPLAHGEFARLNFPKEENGY